MKKDQTLCNEKMEVYSRIVGYITPKSLWNKGKKHEYEVRKTFKLNDAKISKLDKHIKAS